MLAIDKPAGWMLAPEHAHKVINNLHALLMGSIIAGDAWARSRGIRFLRYVHRLDADTTGVLLLAKSKGAIGPLSRCFSDQAVDKVYLAVIDGTPKDEEWNCELPLAAPVKGTGRVTVSRKSGKEAVTRFRRLATLGERTLVACRPLTGRTHQIRVHLAETAGPIVGDRIYGDRREEEEGLGLRAVWLRLRHPFTRREVSVEAPWTRFMRRFGFDPDIIDFAPEAMTRSGSDSGTRRLEHGSQKEAEERGTRGRKGIQGAPQGRSGQGRRR